MRKLFLTFPLLALLGACSGLANLQLPDMMGSTTGGGKVDTGPITEQEFRIALRFLKVFLPEDLTKAADEASAWTPTLEQADAITLICGRYNARTSLVQAVCDKAAKVSAEASLTAP